MRPLFEAVRGRLDEIARPEAFVGRAPAQVDEFLADVVEPVLARFADADPEEASLRV